MELSEHVCMYIHYIAVRLPNQDISVHQVAYAYTLEEYGKYNKWMLMS